MDANYVMDETLGTASFEITKLTVGETKTETFLIGKVRQYKVNVKSYCIVDALYSMCIEARVCRKNSTRHFGG